MQPGVPVDAPRLLELLTQQRDHYARLRELSDRQRATISSDRPEELISILRDRQTHVTALARLNEALSPFRRSWDETYVKLPESSRRQAADLLGEINALLREILRTDQEDSALLAARKQSVAQELGAVAGGQSANRAYARQAQSSPAALGESAGSADLTG